MKRIFFLFFASTIILFSCRDNAKDSNYLEITQKHLQEWQSDKFGMFIHWGLYSIPAGVWNGEKVPFYAEQIMNHARIPVAEYEQLAEQFDPHDWNADEVVRLAKNAGMKYIVFTSKHHDGFCMFKTQTTDYDVVDATPFGRDVVKELAESCKKHGIKLGLYYSLPDWHFQPGVERGTPDSATKCWEHVNQLYSPLEIITPELEEYIANQLEELLTNYGEIETIWFDMGLIKPEQSIRLKNIVKSLQPACLVSGRIMNNQGDYLTLPDNGDVVGYSDLAWDNPASMYGTWGYRSWQERPSIENQVDRQLKRLMQTISHGGVFLLNIGPTGTGKVIDYEQKVLSEIGHWISKNKEAVYNTTASPFEKLDDVCCTKKDNKLYFTVLDSIKSIKCQNLTSAINKVFLLENPEQELKYNPIEQGIEIQLNDSDFGRKYTVVTELSSEVEVLPVYIEQIENQQIILTKENAITHAAFDSYGYISTQSDSWKSWHIDVKHGGTYSIFIEYLPEYYDKSYSFVCGDETIEQILPGVDKMLQTSYAGKMIFLEGKNEFVLKSTSPCSVLEPLGIDIQRIILRPTI